MKLLVFICAGLVLSMGCSKKSESEPQFFFKYDIALDVKKTVSENEAWLIANIQKQEPISYSQLTESFKTLHVQSYNSLVIAANITSSTVRPYSSMEELNTQLQAWSQGLAAEPISDFKAKYETNIQNSLGFRSWDYLATAVSIPHLYKEAASQCYSGTAVFEVLYRTTKPAREFVAANRVVIFEAGHVLPGYVVNHDGKFRLYGSETTASGRGIIDYGYTSEIDEAIRVVDANDFLVVEVIKKYLDPKKTDPMVAAIVKAAAEKYGIDSTKLEAKIFPVQSFVLTASQSAKAVGSVSLTSKRTWDPNVLNASPLGFGVAHEPATRQSRPPIDSRARGNHPFMDPTPIVCTGVCVEARAQKITSLQGLWFPDGSRFIVHLNRYMSSEESSEEGAVVFILGQLKLVCFEVLRVDSQNNFQTLASSSVKTSRSSQSHPQSWFFLRENPNRGLRQTFLITHAQVEFTKGSASGFRDYAGISGRITNQQSSDSYIDSADTERFFEVSPLVVKLFQKANLESVCSSIFSQNK